MLHLCLLLMWQKLWGCQVKSATALIPTTIGCLDFVTKDTPPPPPTFWSFGNFQSRQTYHVHGRKSSRAALVVGRLSPVITRLPLICQAISRRKIASCGRPFSRQIISRIKSGANRCFWLDEERRTLLIQLVLLLLGVKIRFFFPPATDFSILFGLLLFLT